MWHPASPPTSSGIGPLDKREAAIEKQWANEHDTVLLEKLSERMKAPEIPDSHPELKRKLLILPPHPQHAAISPFAAHATLCLQFSWRATAWSPLTR